jgi:hypothetical protein
MPVMIRSVSKPIRHDLINQALTYQQKSTTRHFLGNISYKYIQGQMFSFNSFKRDCIELAVRGI